MVLIMICISPTVSLDKDVIIFVVGRQGNLNAKSGYQEKEIVSVSVDGLYLRSRCGQIFQTR